MRRRIEKERRGALSGRAVFTHFSVSHFSHETRREWRESRPRARRRESTRKQHGLGTTMDALATEAELTRLTMRPLKALCASYSVDHGLTARKRRSW